MNNNDNKYLVLRGKNKDIFFIQKRLSKNLSNIIGKDFIKKSLETKNIDIARKKRDEILAELDLLSKNAAFEANITNNLDNEKKKSIKEKTRKTQSSAKIDVVNLNTEKNKIKTKKTGWWNN